MDIAIVDESAAVHLAADLFTEMFRARHDAVVGLATGSTPTALYRELAARKNRGELPDLSRITGFALDEYIGLPDDHPQKYSAVLAREWTEPLGLSRQQVRLPDTRETGLDTAGERYEAEIAAAGGVDVQILGLGRNGHVGFNEPGSSLRSRTRLKSAKAHAVAAAVEGPVSSHTPASVLQFHERVTVLVDQAAAARLQHQDEYRYAWATRWGGPRLASS